MEKIHWLYPLDVILRGHKKRKTINELSALPDHLLADIGIERDAIPGMVNDMLRPGTAVSGTRSASGSPVSTATDLLLSRA
jgi:uncharacterized protein YjiS (DUF1127 family)